MTLLVNKAELADILGVSMPSLNDWLRKDPNFPVVSRGSNGVEWQFEPGAVIEYRAQVAEAEAAEARKRQEAMEQFRLPLLADASSGGAAPGALTPQQELAMSRKRQLDIEMAKAARFLVLASEVRQDLNPTLVEAGHYLQSVPERLGRKFGWPPDVVLELRQAMDECQREMVRKLRAWLEPAEQTPDAGT